MSRRKRGAPPAPARSMSQRPAVSPPIDALVAERRLIGAMLVARGVLARDCEDVLQNVLIAAWRAVQEGRYRPDPRADPRRALQGWLYGITWRQAGHHLGRAHVRREVPVDEPRALVDEGCVDLEGRLLARAALRALVERPAPPERLDPARRRRDGKAAARSARSSVTYVSTLQSGQRS